MKACSDRDLHIWHWFAGRCGTNNDVTLLRLLPLFVSILNGVHDVELNDKFQFRSTSDMRRLVYFLVDVEYPRWTSFARPIHEPAF